MATNRVFPVILTSYNIATLWDEAHHIAEAHLKRFQVEVVEVVMVGGVKMSVTNFEKKWTALFHFTIEIPERVVRET